MGFDKVMTNLLNSVQPIGMASIIVAGQDNLCCDLAEGAVILNLNSGTYYGLNEVGTFVWKLIQEPRPVAEICEAVVSEYEVSPEQCESDLVRLFEEMAGQGLIEVQSEAHR
jgi:hypothetical protein